MEGAAEQSPAAPEPMVVTEAAVGSDDPPQQFEERAKVKTKRQPYQPTAAEIAEHEAWHEPYRDWCPACVAGRGRSDPHMHIDHGDDAVAKAAMDCT